MKTIDAIRRSWLALAVLALPWAVAERVRADDPRPPETLAFLGMTRPRPADPAERERLGFPPPRSAAVVLAAIDALERQALDPSAGAELAEAERARYFERANLHDRELSRRRIDLVSELEEAGYAGNRLEALLRDKVADVRKIWSRYDRPVSAYAELRHELVRRYPDSRAARQARFDAKLEAIEFILLAGMRVHPDDYPGIAAVESAYPDHEEAGLLLIEALSKSGDAELKGRWFDWIAANLPAKSLGARYVARERGFGKPIRLQGETLDGAKFDSDDWKGCVVLVDFWGLWCQPCREAMPVVADVLARHEVEGLRVVGILCDDRLDAARAWLDERKFSWPQLVDRAITADARERHRIAVQYAVGGFPTLWVIDRKGVLREPGDVEKLGEQVRRFLAEPAGAQSGR